MIIAFVLMALLAALAMGAVVIPLVWPTAEKRLAGQQSNLAILRHARAEIDREFSSGALSQEERAREVLELNARAAAEIDPDTVESPIASRRARPLLALSIAAAIGALSIVLYLKLGDPIALDPALLARMTQAQAHPESDPRVLAMVQTLADRLKNRPNDIEGWTLLGRSQMVLGHYAESAQAYAHATKISPPSAELFANYADALAMAQNRSIEGQPFLLVQKALALDPNNIKALELAGSAELTRGDSRAARGYWQHLAQLLPPGSDASKEVAQALAALDAQSAPTGAAAARAPRSDVNARSSTPAAVTNAHDTSVSGHVTLAAALASRVALSDTVFLFARPVSTKGPRIPLAALRMPASALPHAFTLTDAMAMVPGQTLSSVDRVIIEAFVSKSGRAEPVAGDLMGTSAPVAPGDREVNVVINAVIP